MNNTSWDHKPIFVSVKYFESVSRNMRIHEIYQSLPPCPQLLDVALSVCHVSVLLLHQLQKLGELDGAAAVQVGLHHEIEDVVLGGVLSHGPHHVEQFVSGDTSTAILP